MKISKEHFFSVGSQLPLSQEQLDTFWHNLEKEPTASSLIKYLYYFGALLVIGSMSWLMTLGWAYFGSGGMFLIAAVYALVFALAGGILWKKEKLRIPGGLLITMAVCMVPLIVYSLENYLQYWPQEGKDYPDFYRYLGSNWIFMELATIFAGLIALYFFPFPFLTAPIACAAWFLSMDIALYFNGEMGFVQRGWISIAFGILMLVIAYMLDRNKKGEYAFWTYFFGAAAFWGGLGAVVWDKGEAILFGYGVVNVLMMIAGVVLRRNVLLVFGAFGVFIYLSHLAYDLFRDSLLFPFALTALGLFVITLGILYQKHGARIETFLLNLLPAGIRKWIP